MVSGAAARCALPRRNLTHSKASAKAEGGGAAVRLLVDWGATGCAAAVARFDEGQWRLSLTPQPQPQPQP